MQPYQLYSVFRRTFSKYEKSTDKFTYDSVLYKMCEVDDLEGVQYILSYKKETRFFIDELFCNAAENGSINVLKFFYTDFSPSMDTLQTAVIMSCLNGHLNVLQFLCEVAHCEEIEDTSLVYAASGDHLDILHFWIESIGVKNYHHLNNAFIEAARKGSLSIIEYLSDRDYICYNINEALWLSVYYNHIKVAQFLYERGASLSKEKRDKELIIAVKGRKWKVANFLSRLYASIPNDILRYLINITSTGYYLLNSDCIYYSLNMY